MTRDITTLEELAALPEAAVSPRVAARFLGGSQYGLNVAARNGQLGLPHYFSGNRLKISKAAILDFCGYRPANRNGQE